MDAIVLAAGEGTRFFGKDFEQRPLPSGLEYPIPKALFPVTAPRSSATPRPMLEHLVNALHDGGAETIWIATGHLAEKIGAFVKASLQGSNVKVIPPHPSIDYRRGPLYTLAGALDHLNESGVLASEGFDKMIMLSPADLIIDRKAAWYLAGIPARGMMSSRSRVHMIIENRPNVLSKTVHTALKDIVPPRFRQMFDHALLGCPVVPLVAVHLDVLASAVAGIAKGYTRFSEVLKDWLGTNIRDEHAFRSEVNVIQSMYLGERFYWHDLDTLDAVRDMERVA
jgi:choline kinase